jgi:hypothetical protein
VLVSLRGNSSSLRALRAARIVAIATLIASTSPINLDLLSSLIS